MKRSYPGKRLRNKVERRHRIQALDALEARRLLASVPYRFAGDMDPVGGDVHMSSQDWTDIAAGATGGVVVSGQGSRLGEISVFRSDATRDTSFAGTGKLTFDFGTSDDSLDRLRVLSGNQILAVGKSSNPSNAPTRRAAAFVRVNANGTMDGTFGTGGVLRQNVADTVGSFVALNTQSTGKALALASTGHVMRINANGTVDNAFGSSGILSSFIAAGLNTTAIEMAVLPDDRFYIAGDRSVTGGGATITRIARFTANGQLDTSFHGTGILEVDVPGDAFDHTSGLVVQPATGAIVVGISSGNSQLINAQLRRYDASGALDTSFAGGANGGVANLFGITQQIDHMAIDGQSRIVVTCERSASATPVGTGLLRFTTDGLLDSSFGYGGRAIDLRPRTRVAVGANDDILSLEMDWIGRTLSSTRGDGPVYLDTSGKLQITGTPFDDEISVSVNGSDLLVEVNGQQTINPLSSVQSMAIEARLGFDHITYDVGDAFAGVTNTILAGALSNQFPQPSGANVIDVLSGPANGLLKVNDPGSGYRTWVNVHIDGSVNVSSVPEVTTIGTAGDDFFEVTPNLLTAAGTTISGPLRDINAGDGDDTARYRGVTNIDRGPSLLGEGGNDVYDILRGQASIDGGAGSDTAILGVSAAANYSSSINTSNVIFGPTTLNSYVRTESIRLIGAGGNETLTLWNVGAGTTVTAEMGDGNDTLTMSQNEEEAPLRSNALVFDGGSGTDTVIQNGMGIADSWRFGAGELGYRGAVPAVQYTNVEAARYDGRGGFDDVEVAGGPAVLLSRSQLFDDLIIAAGASVVCANNANTNVTVHTLSLDPVGIFDLANNDLIATSTPQSVIEGHIARAYNFGDWLGAGGIFSSTAKNNANGNTTLGLLSGQQFNDNNGGTFNGVTPNATDALVKYTYFGDVDFNGSVDVSDYNLIDFGFANHLTGWANGDADWSGGATDVSDYNLIDFAFATQSGTL